MSQPPLILCIHIPKAAGTNAAAMFYENYHMRLGVIDMNVWEQWQSVVHLIPDSFDCLFGHFWYGLHENIARACEYTSVMRNPIDAILSYHTYIVRRPDHPFHEAMGNGSLEHFLRLPPEMMYVFRNYQTTMLTGKLNSTAEEAIRLIEKRYPILGTVERFPETAYLWKKRFGWQSIQLHKESAGESVNQASKLSWSSLRSIEELVSVDLEVYSYVRARLAKSIMALSSAEKREIQKLKETGALRPNLH